MLLQFSAKNYRSVGDEIILNMNSANKLTDNKHFLIESDGGNILPVAALFGPNASGKSNILEAFFAMNENIINSTRLDKKGLFATPFFFNEEASEQPTEFEVFFVVNEKEYRYGYILTKAEIKEEWLSVRKFSKNDTKWNPVFKREGSEINYNKYETLKEYNHLIKENMLVLSFFYGKELNNINEFDEVNDWFCNHCRIDNTRNNYYDTLKFYHKDDTLFKGLVEFIKEFDPYVEDVIIKYDEDKDGNRKYVSYTVHNGKEYSVDMESGGTKKLFWLYLAIKRALDVGGIAVVDELDCQLHPLILRRIVKMFHDKAENKSNAQLVFSSHNLIVLDRKELRRDEIWFVEKNKKGFTELFSLADFKTDDKVYRADSDYGKHYLAGRFGAIPYLEDKEV